MARQRDEKAVAPTKRRFTSGMQKKLVVLFFIVLLAFLGLSVRLFLITRDNSEEYKKQVLSQQQYDSTTLPFRRGDILDKNGTTLASSEKVYNLIIDSVAISKDKAYLEPTMKALKQCFDINESELRTYIAENQKSQYKVVLKQLTYEQITPFMELQADIEKGKNIQGVWFEEEYKRYYPNKTLACDVIGFTGKDNAGTYGLEEYYNNVLNGTNGREYGYLNDDETLERTVKPAVDGNSIVTTIDANIQSIVEKHLKKFNDEYKDGPNETGFGANNLGCIIMEVDTGNVLAMASYPDFDLNNPKDISAYYTEEEIRTMEENDTLYDAYNGLWRNFCISDSYEPGSTIKPFTVASALDAGSIKGNETYMCTGMRKIGDYEIECHNTYGDGEIDVKTAVEQSCNVALMYIAESLGTTRFCEYQHNFNFGLKTNIDLAGEARTDSLIYNTKTMGPTELATNSFGQSFNTTMIQMITGYCSLINGGKYYEPHMVSKIIGADGSTVETIEPRVLKQTVSESVSETIIDYCNGVVTNGTGKTARPAGYAIGGKTGTAETLPRGNNEYVVSFMGYAPADDPQIAIYVVVDRPNVQYQDDAKYATRIVRSILTEVLPYMNIFMTEEVSESEAAELRALQLEITTQYRHQANDIAGEGTEETALPEEGETSQEEGSEEEGSAEEGNEPSGENAEGSEDAFVPEVWKTFEVDPATGYYIDPNNGHLIDPETGHDMTEGSLMQGM